MSVGVAVSEEDEEEEKLSNNLENVKKDNDVFRIEQGRLSRYLSLEMQTLFKALKEAPIVAADLYYSLYSLSPTVTADRNDNEFLESMRQMMGQIIQSPQFQQLRNGTELNEEQSTLYTAAIMRELLKDMQKQLEKQQKQDPWQYTDQNGDPQKLSELIKKAMEGDKSAQRQLQEMLDELAKSGEGQKIADKLKDLLSNGKSELDKEVQKMQQEAAQQAQQQGQGQQGQQGNQQQGNGKGSGKGNPNQGYGIDKYSTMPVENAKAIEALTKRLVKAMPEFSDNKVKMPMGDRVAGLGMTKNIAKAFLRELAMPKEMVIAKAFEGWLTFDKFTSFNGAYYVLIDKSGSMSSYGGGADNKSIWARSVALALLEKAKAKGRKYYLRFFDDDFSERLEKPDEIKQAITSVASDGGTTIDKALAVAIADMTRDKKLAKSTNTIILISDGEDNVTPEFKQLLKDNKIKLITIMIDGDNETLKEISEAYFKVKPTEKNAIRLLEEIKRSDEKSKKKRDYSRPTSSMSMPLRTEGADASASVQAEPAEPKLRTERADRGKSTSAPS